MGTEAHTTEILDTIFGKNNWKYRVYSNKDNVSIDIRHLTEQKK
ncbi:hypothetical protein [Borrelia turcica]|nr:hypothetical protein [Borrelia turcica]